MNVLSRQTCDRDNFFPVGIQEDELEAFLETLLDQEFDTIIDDGSTPEVGHVVISTYHMI